MLRARLPRRALFSAAAAAAIAVAPREEKPPIYPVPEPQLVLIDTPSELERQIRLGRERLTARYADSYAYVQGWVDRWIGVEQAVEQRIKSFKAPDEQLTPGILYVGVATLSGSILARSRGLPTRFLLPPTLFLLSFNHFLPKTTSNIGAYVSDLEHTYAPRAAQFTDTAVAHTQMTWEMAKDKVGEGRAALERGVESAVGSVQGATGLKLREALGMSRAFGKVAEERGREALTVAEGQGKAALHVAEEKGRETAKKIEDAVEKKVDEVKRLV
ncbi:uncharacterized protein FOMMEDRAFT_105442 [Fomitiporia mediterranea MF3/22]|uniref:uncharacterized protein n=1 Tax=Fomitiporia mediterranea (strain MF3/22) TaxID=694068 RepID=UPI0004407B4E|nr:uncharacterized protein FOMMEDRAFT_105442 [Fomitiporia mediterranea MF3/22]EJD05217.1 hypothetical protein FOMMEDRAFT_105442 [Fomitiporia mediterranea MF3/22]